MYMGAMRIQLDDTSPLVSRISTRELFSWTCVTAHASNFVSLLFFAIRAVVSPQRHIHPTI